MHAMEAVNIMRIKHEAGEMNQWMMHLLCKDQSSNPQHPHKGRYSKLISNCIIPASRWKTETGEEKFTGCLAGCSQEQTT